MNICKIEKELFKLFSKRNCEDYDLFCDIVKLLEVLEEQAKGESTAYYYDVLRQMSNSENNAGWDKDKAHRFQLDLISLEMHRICDEFEEYLP